jgi:DNA-binding SARP family transcriptional activator
MRLRFLVLGEVSVTTDRPDPAPPPAMVRGVLAALLLRPNQFVAVPQLCRDLWDDPPVSAPSNLRTYAARVRRMLVAADATGALGGRLVARRGSGYRLTVEPGELDLEVFRTLAARGQRYLHEGRYGPAVDALTGAARLWRGTPGDDVPPGGLLSAALGALAEYRVEVLDDLAEARLAAGDLAGLRAELSARVAAYPLRERGYALLMRLLYRTGDASAALALYHRARTRLRIELGTQPGAELRRLHQAVLRQDDAVLAARLVLAG